ncbi:hypothetical protein SUGI_1004890 [Cryptomeria japonica]|nr:hypothetical protein SUGI_1004890 [Cryptomeria japonica]
MQLQINTAGNGIQTYLITNLPLFIYVFIASASNQGSNSTTPIERKEKGTKTFKFFTFVIIYLPNYRQVQLAAISTTTNQTSTTHSSPHTNERLYSLDLICFLLLNAHRPDSSSLVLPHILVTLL